MKRYLLAVGGTGGRILESVAWWAAADAMRDEAGPLAQVALMAVDVGAGDAGIARAAEAVSAYEAVRALFAGFPYAHRGFHTALSLARWSPACIPAGDKAESRADRLLARALLTEDERACSGADGLHGSARLGALRFADALSSDPVLRADQAADAAAPETTGEIVQPCAPALQDTATPEKATSPADAATSETTGEIAQPSAPALQDASAPEKAASPADAATSETTGETPQPSAPAPQDPAALEKLLDDMARTLQAGEEVRVVLAGSASGGTGAAGIPALARLLRARLGGLPGRLALAAVLVLPCCREDAVPARMTARAREVLRSGGFTAETLEATYVLGLPESCFTSLHGEAHAVHALAARAAARFLGAAEAGCFYYRLSPARLDWETLGERLRRDAGGLAKTAALWLAEVGPALAALLPDPAAKRSSMPGWYAAHFLRAVKADGEARVRLANAGALVTQALGGYARWLCGMVRTLPPQLRHADALVRAAGESLDNYRRLVDERLRVRQLSLQAERLAQGRILRVVDEDAQTVSDTLRQREDVLARLQAKQADTDAATGGELRLTMARRYLAELAQRTLDEEKACAALQVQGETEEDTPERAREKAETLLRAQGRVQAAKAREAAVAEDVRRFAAPEMRCVAPACAEGTGDDYSSALFGGEALACLWAVCEQGDAGAPERLLAHLQDLVCVPDGDRVNAAEVYARLGSGAGSRRGVDPVALLLARVQESVLKEEKA